MYWNNLRPAEVIKVARKRIRVLIKTKGGYFIGSWRPMVYKENNGQKTLEVYVDSE